MPTRLCLDARCPEVAVAGGRCRRHSAAHAAQTRSYGHALYRTKRWRVLRRRVLFEQPLCPCGALAVEVDHIVSLVRGGDPWKRSNLQGLCKRCHGEKTRREQLGRPDPPDGSEQ